MTGRAWKAGVCFGGQERVGGRVCSGTWFHLLTVCAVTFVSFTVAGIARGALVVFGGAIVPGGALGAFLPGVGVGVALGGIVVIVVAVGAGPKVAGNVGAVLAHVAVDEFAGGGDGGK